MTRNIITELVIRLLAIWLFINSVASLIPVFEYAKSFEEAFWTCIATFLFPITISIILIVFSAHISKIIWTGRQDDEIIKHNEGKDTFAALISILGLYFIITSLSASIHYIIEILTILPRYGVYGVKGTINAYSISRLIYNGIILAFGILIFSLPEGIMSIRNTISDFLSKKRINDDENEER
jgi:hypothetical protein